MSTDNKVPEIRFKGFSEDWEKRLLGSLCLIGDIDHRMPESKTTGIPYLMTGDFHGINGLDFNCAKLISIEDYEQLSKKIKPEFGDILFARYASIGSVRYVETDTKFLISYSCAILKTNNTTYGKYLFYFFQTERTQGQLELDINTGSQRNIGIDSLKSLLVALPKSVEQAQIGNVFQKFDSLINQHQQKHDKLSNIKKAMLEKMFPKQGETIPKIRFKDLNGEWAYTPLSKIADKYDNLRIPVTAKDRISGNTPYYGANGIQGYIEGYTHDGEYVLLAEDGANDLKNYPIQYVNGKVWVNNHAHVLKAKERYSNLFIKYALVSIDFEPFLVGGGRSKLNASVMMDLEIAFTENIEEQAAIGNYFQKLDTLINQHQQQITKLNNIKQACLSKMFV
ncbi:restriction endonuclease subunit S [Shewanella sp. DC2-4]|uniref:restriction endonuclease subunit S n=1 Tax=Shewanella sp. DC2-4 TaxID=2739431 RepID=UPI0015668297|nr:restriction endonuclease subunit S [Shewanella sp. DC2-4]NRD34681.1 restriction endonuclease subunit S [Shewanella sp. DC2-4]